MGTTISDLEAALQAMWPGNCSTSGTSRVRLGPTAAAHAPPAPDAGAGNRPLKRAEYQLVAFYQVKPYPKEAERLPQRGGRVGEVGREVSFAGRQGFDLGQELPVLLGFAAGRSKNKLFGHVRKC